MGSQCPISLCVAMEKVHGHMEQTDGCQREGELGGWMKEDEEIKQKLYIYHIDRSECFL